MRGQSGQRGRRVRAGPAPPSRASEALAELRRTPFLVAVAWGTIWRYAAVGAVTLAMFSGARPPLVVVAAIGVGGLLLSLWRWRCWGSGLWRAAMLGWATGASSGSGLFPYLIAGTLAVVTVEPWLVARGRQVRAPAATRSRSPESAAAAPRPPSPELPEVVWPRARRRG